MPVAVKKFSLNGTMQGKTLREWKNEAGMLKDAKYDRIVQLVAVTENPYCIVMPLMEGGNEYDVGCHEFAESGCKFNFNFFFVGSLCSLIEADREINDSLKQQLMMDVAKGMAFLHSINVIHR
jgi:serine/threonine protein kinase